MAGPPRSPPGLTEAGGFLPLSRAVGGGVGESPELAVGWQSSGPVRGALPSAASYLNGTFPFMVHSFSQEKELLEVTPAPTSVHEAVVQGDKRTYAVYDLLSPSLFNTSRSLNVQLKWKRPQDSCERPELRSTRTSGWGSAPKNHLALPPTPLSFSLSQRNCQHPYCTLSAT